MPLLETVPPIFHVKRAGMTRAATLCRTTARATLRQLDDHERREKRLPPDMSPHHIQYSAVTPDVLRWEDLFDQRATQQVIDLLTHKQSLAARVMDLSAGVMTGTTELNDIEVARFIGELEDLDMLEGCSTRRLDYTRLYNFLEVTTKQQIIDYWK